MGQHTPEALGIGATWAQSVTTETAPEIPEDEQDIDGLEEALGIIEGAQPAPSEEQAAMWTRWLRWLTSRGHRRDALVNVADTWVTGRYTGGGRSA